MNPSFSEKREDLAGFRLEATNSRRLGYVGKQVVHPSQIEVANEVFSPKDEEISNAKKIVELYEAASKEHSVGALRVDDKLIDAVHYRRARSILEAANEM
jgi:citrate lyase subunit beta / citryl-CoA lyase